MKSVVLLCIQILVCLTGIAIGAFILGHYTFTDDTPVIITIFCISTVVGIVTKPIQTRIWNERPYVYGFPEATSFVLWMLSLLPVMIGLLMLVIYGICEMSYYVYTLGVTSR